MLIIKKKKNPGSDTEANQGLKCLCVAVPVAHGPGTAPGVDGLLTAQVCKGAEAMPLLLTREKQTVMEMCG